jgi:hypothetical protein
MNINDERTLLIKEIQKIDDPTLLHALKTVLLYGLKNEGRVSIDQYNLEIEEAEKRISDGLYFTQEEVEKMAKDW